MSTARKDNSQAWEIRGHLARNSYLVVGLIGFLMVLLLWWGLAASGWVSSVFLPGPPKVVGRFITWMTQDNLLDDAAISIYRVGAGFLLSMLMAVPLGLIIGTFKPIEAFFEPIIEFARYLPAVAFVPLVLLWVGIDEGAKITIIWIGTFFQMVLMISEDVRRVPMAQIEAAQTLGADR